MNFKKEYDYILKNEVDITIYDRLRVLIKEFGEEGYGMSMSYISEKCEEERKFHINNQSFIDEELRVSEYIEDEILNGLIGEIRKRKEKLHRIKEYASNHIIMDGIIYFQNLKRGDDIWFATEDRSIGVSAHVVSYSIETKEAKRDLTLEILLNVLDGKI